MTGLAWVCLCPPLRPWGTRQLAIRGIEIGSKVCPRAEMLSRTRGGAREQGAMGIRQPPRV